jgi:hypothetical protein
VNDARRLWVATATLFVVGAWPLLACDIPPLEDLPAHLATSVVIRHPELYPQFVFHGFFKTNATLFVWLQAFPEARLVLASKLFVALVVFAHAWVFPRLVLEMGGRDRVVAGTLLAAPLVHNWFVAMGMLDYALGSALGLACVLLLARQAREPSRGRAVAIGALAVAVWYAHVFALAFVVMLALVEIARRRDGKTLRAVAPLGVGVALALVSAARDFAHGAALDHSASYRPPWEMVYELWAKYAWSFTLAEITSLVLCVVLVVSCVRERRADAPFLSPVAIVVMLAFFFLVPHEALGWGNVSVRVLPFLYAAALVRAPAAPARAMLVVLGACAVAWSAGLGRGYQRLARDFAELEAGVASVPKNADLMPMIFAPKGSSDNTWALDHAWAAYVLAKHTSAPLLFAHLPGHPVGYRVAPADDEHPLRVERDIQEAWRDPNAAPELSRVAERHAWVLVFGATRPSFAPAHHEVVFARDRLKILGPSP